MGLDGGDESRPFQPRPTNHADVYVVVPSAVLGTSSATTHKDFHHATLTLQLGRPNERYSNPRVRIFPGERRLRPSMMSGRDIDSRTLLQSRSRNSFHSV